MALQIRLGQLSKVNKTKLVIGRPYWDVLLNLNWDYPLTITNGAHFSYYLTHWYIKCRST